MDEVVQDALDAAWYHILELEEAWRSGALSSCDGKDGQRSAHNIHVREKLREARRIAGKRTKNLSQDTTTPTL